MPSWRIYVAGKSPISLLDLNQIWNYRQIFIKTLNTKFHENSSRADTLKTNGQTGCWVDGKDDANRRFSGQCECA
jgi:hypothetical protein